jgi:hypothetical protein
MAGLLNTVGFRCTIIKATFNMDGNMTTKPRTKLKKKRMIEAIEADGGLIDGNLCNRHTRVCSHVGRCAMGALLINADRFSEDFLTTKELIRFERVFGGSSDDIFYGSPRTDEYNPYAETEQDDKDFALRNRVLHIVEKVYGMDSDHVEMLISANDNFKDRLSLETDINVDTLSNKQLRELRAQHVINVIRKEMF